MSASVRDEQPDRSFSNIRGKTGGRERLVYITVVFTTVPGSLLALKNAVELSRELSLHIRILVPQVVAYPLSLDWPAVDPKFKLKEFRLLCEGNLH